MNLSRLLGATALAGTLFIAPVTAGAQVSTTTAGTQDLPADQAKNPDQAEADGQAAGEILVTGSRIRRPNDDSSVPITTVRPDELLASGSVSLGDALNDLPSLRSTFSQSNSTRFIGTAGLNLLDLRGLGTTRTLTLVNGRRHVTSTPGSFEVDTNTIPSDLLERVDIITGGASALYGSDAVAGVVNFVLRRDFDGVTAHAQGGISERGDRGQYFGSITAGRNFSEGRGNVAVAVEYSRANALTTSQRPNQTGAFTGQIGLFTTQNTIGEPASGDGISDTTFLRNVRSNQYGSGGGVVVACPTAAAVGETAAAFAARRAAVCTGFVDPTTTGQLAYGFFFQPGGTLVRNDAAAGVTSDLRRLAGGTSVIGGLGSTFNETGQLFPQIERYSTNLLAHYDFSNAFQVYFEGKYVNIYTVQESSPTFQGGTLPVAMSRTNPFLSAQNTALLNQILSPTATTFTVARNNIDFGARAEYKRNQTWRAVLSVKGDLSDHLNYEIAGNYGKFRGYYRTGGNVLIQNYINAQNAVLAPATFTGTNFAITPNGTRAICRINLTTNVDPNCVPLNLFGSGSPDPRALSYVQTTSYRNETARQINGTAYIAGDTGGFFNLPGGAIGAVLGVEYRKESAQSAYDPIVSSPARLTFLNAIAPFNPPSLEVKEAYGELRVPLLKDIPFINELTFEGAGRVSDYNYGPSKAVFAWNGGVIWSPVNDLRLRVSYGKSVRSPTIGDLFATDTQTFAALADPCSQTNINAGPFRVANCAAAGVPTTITIRNADGTTRTVPFVNTPTSTPSGLNRGNPTLMEETSRSFTAGGVYKPSFLPGLTLSVDYYAIEIKNVINSLAAQTVVNLCYDNPSGINNQYCQAVFRRADGTFAGQAGNSVGGEIISYTDISPSFFQQPFNFARQTTRGIDFDLGYERRMGANTRLNIHGIATYVLSRRNYTDVTNGDFATRLDGGLGDPTWAANINASIDFGVFDIAYTFRYLDKMTIGAYATQNSVQGRPPTNADAFPQVRYPVITYSDLRVGIEPTDEFRFYIGVDNVFDRLPPDISGLFGTGAGGAIYSALGRYMYAGATLKF